MGGFKIFLILVFLLLLVAIATPTNGGNALGRPSVNNADCGSSTVGLTGETAAGLAIRCNKSLTTVKQLNPWITGPNQSVAGQTVLVPSSILDSFTPASQPVNSVIIPNPSVTGAEIVDVPAVPVTGAVPQPARGSFYYTIQAGDTLFEIAQAYGTSVEILQAANRIPDPNYIITGTQILIP